MNDEFILAIRKHQTAFGLELSDEAIASLARHFELVMEANEHLHLVGPSSPEEFAIRHTLESLALLEHLPERSRLADIGPGAGFPSLPCMLVRDDLKGYLIESKKKKADFLVSATAELGLEDRANVINKQFSETPRPDVTHVTCRALDGFTRHLGRMSKWSGNAQMLLFGGPSLRESLELHRLRFTEHLLPLSEQRFLFICGRR